MIIALAEFIILVIGAEANLVATAELCTFFPVEVALVSAVNKPETDIEAEILTPSPGNHNESHF